MNPSDFRILVADDDADILNGTARLLERVGYLVDRASDGPETLRKARDCPPDLLLLDREMPGTDGLEVCRRIKADPALADIFVVIISGKYTESSRQAEGLEQGADGYIARPIISREFLARIDSFVRILGLSRSLNAALQEKRTLLRELQHRIKNSFGMICSMIALASDDRASPETAGALMQLDARVRSLAELYSLLDKTGSFDEVRLDEYCSSVARSIIGESDSLSLELDTERIVASARITAPIGLILAELITNAVKYAFSPGSHGSIAVALRKKGDKVLLEVRDDGKGLPPRFDPAASAGMGLKLVAGLVDQIGGSFSMEGSTGGTKCSVEFDLGRDSSLLDSQRGK